MCETKRCKICNQDLPITNFYSVKKSNGKVYYRVTCKKCFLTKRAYRKNTNNACRKLTDSYLRTQFSRLKTNPFNSLEEYRIYLLDMRKHKVPKGFFKCSGCKVVFKKTGSRNDKLQCCPTCLKIRSQEYRLKHKEKLSEQNKAYKKENVELLNDRYMKQVLKRFMQKYGFKYDEIPPEFLELYKAKIKLNRKLKDK